MGINGKWPGSTAVEGGSYTCSQGATPGVATLTCAPSFDGLEVTGTFHLSDGLGGTLVVPEAKLDKVALSASGGGQSATLFIRDKRWKWAYPVISGRYNRKDDAGQLIKSTEKKPRDLVKLCLKALKVSGRVTIKGLPTTVRPEVDWDFTPAREALQQVIEPLGCRVVYDVAGNAVLIVPLGAGGKLPGGSLADDAPGVTVPEVPPRLKVVGAPIRYQFRVMLQAVGLDIDGLIKPIDELSYAPTAAKGGWERSAPPYFVNIPATADLPGSLTHEKAVGMAKESVYRWFRVFVEPTYGQTVPKYKGKVKRWQQIILTPEKVTTGKDDAQNPTVIRAEVFGVHWDGRPALTNRAATDGVQVGFSIDAERGLVIFDRPIYKLEDSKFKLPTLTIETAVNIRDEKTDGLVRYEKIYRTGSKLKCEPLVVIHEDIRYTVEQPYDSDGKKKAIKDNKKEVEAVAKYYRDGTLRTLGGNESEERGYNGIVPIRLDGAIQQASWNIGLGGADTRASRNTEHQPYILPYPERRRRELDIPALQAEKERQKVADNRRQRALTFLGVS